MTMRILTVLLATIAFSCKTPVAQQGASTTPNIVYIMSDELAYYEVGYMGNALLKTPRIDRMAAEGMVFTHALAGSPVCAPLRCNLMTGKHSGHASVRANDGGTPLVEGEETIASMLKQKGYATGGFGKWGAGGRGSTGVPEKHGFDVFFGYYDQVHAHSFYPPYLVRNSREVVLPGNQGGRSGQTYSHYEIMKEGLQFIRDNKDKPFFCYLPITPPHGMYDIPADDPAWNHYEGANYPGEAANYAAMVSMVDRNVGEVLDLLRELGLEENTIVFFTGDNGGQDRFRTPDRPRGFFGPNVHPKTGVEFRGGKGNLYEGGLRIPAIVRWPGRIKPGVVSDLIWYQPDILPTLAELTGTTPPGDIDGLSILPTILGRDGQKLHEFFYWEYGKMTAVREKHWKAVRPAPDKPWALYDLSKDVSETTDISAAHPDRIRKMAAWAEASHIPVRPGTFADRTDHERDRWAKWGTAKRPAPKGRKKVAWPKKDLLPGVTVARFSSQAAGSDRFAKFAVDGEPWTWWHTDWSANPPHEIVLDLGSAKNVRGIRYLARPDAGWNGSLGKVTIHLSDDPKAPGDAVATHTFGKTKKPQEATFDAARGRYLTIRVASEINGGKWASIAEIGVIGK